MTKIGGMEKERGFSRTREGEGGGGLLSVSRTAASSYQSHKLQDLDDNGCDVEGTKKCYIPQRRPVGKRLSDCEAERGRPCGKVAAGEI